MTGPLASLALIYQNEQTARKTLSLRAFAN